jgi:hypothetical protein
LITVPDWLEEWKWRVLQPMPFFELSQPSISLSEPDSWA